MHRNQRKSQHQHQRLEVNGHNVDAAETVTKKKPLYLTSSLNKSKYVIVFFGALIAFSILSYILMVMVNTRSSTSASSWSSSSNSKKVEPAEPQQLSSKWFQEKYIHSLGTLSPQGYRHLVSLEEQVDFQSLLDPILIVRVPGTPGHSKVNNFIKSHMSSLDWHVETDAFQEMTPHGLKPFENIIATLDPSKPRRLVLACHYDSKYFKDQVFLGATDSAVPCAMLLHLASTMNSLLSEHRKGSGQNVNVTLQFIFFDGEEAFHEWTAEDSIYGARHLAAKWAGMKYPSSSGGNSPSASAKTYLDRIDLLVLLDLLGVEGARLHSYFQATAHWFNALKWAENELKKSKDWDMTSSSSKQSMFQGKGFDGGAVEDDHIPFLMRGVDILHLIPLPFPKVWHEPSDNREALHFPTIANLNKVLRLFVARYLHLPVINSEAN